MVSENFRALANLGCLNSFTITFFNQKFQEESVYETMKTTQTQLGAGTPPAFDDQGMPINDGSGTPVVDPGTPVVGGEIDFDDYLDVPVAEEEEKKEDDSHLRTLTMIDRNFSSQPSLISDALVKF